MPDKKKIIPNKQRPNYQVWVIVILIGLIFGIAYLNQSSTHSSWLSRALNHTAIRSSWRPPLTAARFVAAGWAIHDTRFDFRGSRSGFGGRGGGGFGGGGLGGPSGAYHKDEGILIGQVDLEVWEAQQRASIQRRNLLGLGCLSIGIMITVRRRRQKSK